MRLITQSYFSFKRHSLKSEHARANQMDESISTGAKHLFCTAVLHLNLSRSCKNPNFFLMHQRIHQLLFNHLLMQSVSCDQNRRHSALCYLNKSVCMSLLPSGDQFIVIPQYLSTCTILITTYSNIPFNEQFKD